MSAFKPNYISTADLAKFLGISRVAVLKRIQKGQIPAIKIGRSYGIPETVLHEHFPEYRSRLLDDQIYVSVMQAAEILNVTRSAISKRIERGQLPAKRVGRHYVINRADIDAHLSQTSQRVVTQKEFISIPECARLLGVSRVAVFKRVQQGTIKAEKVGRSYVIAVRELETVVSQTKKTGPKKNEYWSVPQAAEYLGISRVAVFKQIQRGKIKSQRIGRRYVIDSKEVRGLKRE